MSTALLTDRYELTMVDAALRSGQADVPAVFEVFTRRLPDRRPWGVFAGLGRLVDALEDFCFGPGELSWLEESGVVSRRALEWLSAYRFSGRIDAYREGELFTAGSPVLTVEATFAEAVLLETLVLSVLNFDSAVASAASLITWAAGDRPVIEMGSRRVDPSAAVAAARAAYIGGFASTSNLEAGRRYGLPTAGTASHAFVLAYPSEQQAFTAQVEALGPGTTLLVDTYDIQGGIRAAVRAAGPGLGAVRIDSGDLGREAVRARALLDELGAGATRLVVTGDLDAHTIAALGAAPVDVYGVGANVVTGMGVPTAGFVYKLVAVGDPWRAVAKRSAGKVSHGGRKWAYRALLPEGVVVPEPGLPAQEGPVWADVVSTSPTAPPGPSRALQVEVVLGGRAVHRPPLPEVRSYHRQVRAQVGAEPLVLHRRGAPGPGEARVSGVSQGQEPPPRL